MITPSDIIWHGTNPEIASWPETKRITAVELAPGASGGVKVTLDPYNPGIGQDSRWPDVLPPGWDGTIRWTLCLAVKVDGVWHGAAFHEMWHDRTWTGAGLLDTWNDGWANYDRDFGDELKRYRPKAGDEAYVMAVAGQMRLRKDLINVRERSNMVKVTLADRATYTFETPAVGPVTTETHTGPTVNTGSGETSGASVATLAALLIELGKITSRLDSIDDRLRRTEYRGEGSLGPLKGVAVLKPSLPDRKAA